MTQRSMPAGQTPAIVIRGGSVTIEGWDSDRIQANSDDRWGVQIEKRKVADLGREAREPPSAIESCSTFRSPTRSINPGVC
jgi:hypothetical protein